MTAALFRLAPGALAGRGPGDVVTLDGAEGHHAATVKRARVGEELLVADGSGLLGQGSVVEVADGLVRVELALLRPGAPDGPRFVLAQALAKGGRDEQAVEAATELGVDAVLAWQAGRSVVVWRPERAEKSLRKWVTLAEAASKQSRRATVPEVRGPVSTAGLAAEMARADLALVLHEDATTPLAGLDLPELGDVVIVVGPEGGIDPAELAAFEAAGAVPVRLGATVLRSSSAGPTALAVLCAATRWR
ncbi:16S rRNA (uracil(1498)-N(3))-methyltransferase [Agilicoccus flavus]|uniref:16S rRNA (uracil(1498)-N(3))-methyltransferase n=1 Tax=Agilicoccus flavus TaxID=2775968 RepID=UPI001CF63C29|nr:16S rRNA (uracil(1498)-N(3))-methyltransferase [Agilicoccus flavus]